EGQNLTVNRRIVDFDVEKGGLWKKVGVLMSIRSEASDIVKAKPDLALTIGTPATKYAKDRIISAGIPLVFTAVAIPEAAGCKSLSEAGDGFTGATLYVDMKGVLQIVRLAFPDAKTIGIVHTDDDNGMAQVEDAKLKAPQVGMNVISKEVNKKDSIKPAIAELCNQGAQIFAVPLDSYYGMRDYEPTHDLDIETLARRLPVFSLVLWKSPGAILYVGADFGVIGTLSGQQAVKILIDGASPGSLPVLKQEELKIMVDIKRMNELNIQLPLEVLQIAKSVE
ncbi:MAG TPA: hypothetical protein ENN05_00235, partial [Deltaproteobacteria bacterium]|nr:hypothetical protein [Deltaproteobacteria bacterium]